MNPAAGGLEAMHWSIRSDAIGMHAAVRVGDDPFPAPNSGERSVMACSHAKSDDLRPQDWVGA